MGPMVQREQAHKGECWDPWIRAKAKQWKKERPWIRCKWPKKKDAKERVFEWDQSEARRKDKSKDSLGE